MKYQRPVVAVFALNLLFTWTLSTRGDDSHWRLLYTSTNLANHSISVECSPGDDTTNCPCSTSDVQLVVHPNYGEVIGNVRLTNVYVNAIAYRRFLDTFPDGAPLELDVFRYKADLRLPVIPHPTGTQTQNAQSAHIMIQMWDGSNRLWQANKVALEATVFWSLNPYSTNDFGTIYAYTTVTGMLKYVDTGLKLPIDTNWHTLELVADFVNQKFVSVRADTNRVDLSSLAVASVLRTNWMNELLYHITQESCPTYPGPGYHNIFTWATEFRNLEFSRLAVEMGLADPPAISNNLYLEWSSEPYLKYRVITSQNLTAWGDLSGTIAGDGTKLCYPTSITNQPHLFYRLNVIP